MAARPKSGNCHAITRYKTRYSQKCLERAPRTRMVPLLTSAASRFLLLLLACRMTTATTYCDQYASYTAGNYTISTNQWGADGSGYLCLTSFNSSAGPGASFVVDWQWTNNPTQVHAYPNAGLNSTNPLPIPIRSLQSVPVFINYTQSITPDLMANAAIDMFFDDTAMNATSSTQARYEMMVWFGRYGDINPISSSHAPIAQRSIAGTTFQLYMGQNSVGQTVYSWVATANTTMFSGDIVGLIQSISLRHNGPAMQSAYLGVIEFGTETFHSSTLAHFVAENVQMSVVNGTTPPFVEDVAIAQASAGARQFRPPRVFAFLSQLLRRK